MRTPQKNITEESSSFEKEKVDQAKRIIAPFMLRRLKETVLKDLPEKTISVRKCDLLPDQRVKYDELVAELKGNYGVQDSNSYMMYFMMMRKMANHPLLLRYQFNVCGPSPFLYIYK